jgi:hypothetical protein
MNSYFGVLFTSRPLPRDEEIIETIDLTGFGLPDREVKGFFTNVTIST